MSTSDVAASYDYFSPFLSARIITANGTGDSYPLWTSKASGKSIAVPAGPADTLRALSFLTELQVELQLASIPRITAKLEPPYIDAVKFMDSDLIEFGPNRLQVQFGYARGVLIGGKVGALLSDPMEGMMLRPEITLGTDTSIILTAQGTNGSVTTNQPGSGETLKGKRRDIITKLCERSGMEANFEAVSKDAEVSKLLDKEDTISQGWKSDIYLLHYISNLCGCFTRVVKNNSDSSKGVYEVLPRSRLGAIEPEHTLAMYHLPKGQIGGSVFPMLSASSPPGALFLPGVRTLIMREIDLKTGKTVESKFDDQKVKAAQTDPAPGGVKAGAAPIAEPDPNKPVGYQPHPGDPGAQTFTEQAKAAFEAQKLAMGFPLDVETVGVPTITPGDIVSLKGLGIRLDHNYLVMKVVHTLSASGYSSSLHLISNGGSLVSVQNAIKAYGSENTKDAPVGGGGDTVTASPSKGT